MIPGNGEVRENERRHGSGNEVGVYRKGCN